MLMQPLKNDLPSTSDSFYTPSKTKNVSSIQTNPSVNIGNNPSSINFLSPSPINLITPSSKMKSVQSYQYSIIELSQSMRGSSSKNYSPSDQYSNIELSESIHASPSFMSPNKEIGSFLMTPNYSSNQLTYRRQLPSEFRLKTESMIEISKMQEVSSSDERQIKKVPQCQITEFIKLLQKLRLAKWAREQVQRRTNQQLALNQYLTKKVNQKQQDILYHKKQVQKRILKKNQLKTKIKTKKYQKRKQQANFINQIQTKINILQQNYRETSKIVDLEIKRITMLQQQKMHYQAQLNQRSYYHQYHQFHQYHHQNHNYPYSYPSSHYLPNNPEQFYQNTKSSKQYSTTKRVPLNENYNSSSTPNSSRKSRDISPNSNTTSQQESRSSKNDNGLFDILKHRLINQLTQLQSQQQGTQTTSTQQNSIADMVQKALSMKINGIQRQQTNPNHTQINPSEKTKKQKLSLLFKDIGLISPIENSNNDKNQKIKTFLQKRNKTKSPDRRILQQMIECLSDKEDSPCPQISQKYKSDTESQIAIDYDSIQNCSDYKLKEESQIFSARNRQQNKDEKSPRLKGTVLSSKKRENVPKNMMQSSVNIMYESQDMQNLLKNYQFFTAQIITESIKKRSGSQIHKVSHQIEEEKESRKAESKLNDSSKRSGNETPVFRSQISESDQEIKFSQLLLGQLRNSRGREREIGYSQESGNLEQKGDFHQKNRNERKPILVNHHNNMVKVFDDQKGSKQTNNDLSLAFKTIQRQPQQLEDDIDDDDFLNCNLNLESKIMIQTDEASSPRKSNHTDIFLIEKQQDQQYEDIFEEVRNSNSSKIQSTQKSVKKLSPVRQKRPSVDSLSKTKKSYLFQVVPEQDQALEEDKSSLINKKLKLKKNSKITL